MIYIIFLSVAVVVSILLISISYYYHVRKHLKQIKAQLEYAQKLPLNRAKNDFIESALDDVNFLLIGKYPPNKYLGTEV